MLPEKLANILSKARGRNTRLRQPESPLSYCIDCLEELDASFGVVDGIAAATYSYQDLQPETHVSTPGRRGLHYLEQETNNAFACVTRSWLPANI